MDFDLGSRLKSLREANGLSIYKLSSISGVSKSYITEIEKGVKKNLQLNTLESLCKALNTSLAEFFSREVGPPDITINQKRLLEISKNLSDDEVESLVILLNRIANHGNER